VADLRRAVIPLIFELADMSLEQRHIAAVSQSIAQAFSISLVAEVLKHGRLGQAWWMPSTLT
jgi:hypothetical protein